MNTITSYLETATAYADGVHALFAPPEKPAGDRGWHGPKSHEELADQAENLLPISEDLTQAAALLFTDTDPEIRAQASAKLMAKALTDLEISAYLLQSAADEEKQVKLTGGHGTDRSKYGHGNIDEYLDVLLEKDKTASDLADRTSEQLRDIPAARIELNNAINDTLKLILKRASKAGQTSVAGIMGLGMSEIAKAAGATVMEIADVMGQAEKVTRLYNLFRSFVTKAYGSVTALLGESLCREAAEQFLKWLDELNSEENAARLLENLYQTELTRNELNPVVAGNQAELDRFVSAFHGVNTLDERYQQQVKLAEKLIGWMKYLAGVASSALPQGKLVAAGVYIILGSYVILVGADYVDAPGLNLLDRIPGVRQIVESNLRTDGSE